MQAAIHIDGDYLLLGDELAYLSPVDLRAVRRICVVGAGKAGAGMAETLESLLGPKLCREKLLTGWVNVPADCVRKLAYIHLHAARQAGRNEPTAEGVAGAEEILRLVSSLGPQDLCLCLIGGGGSALLPVPAEGVSLADKLAITRFLSAAGANINELNTVRKQISRIKGGGLARACRAGQLVSLIISDVLGDPLDIIASGPTVEDPSTPADALAVLAKYAVDRGIAPSVFEHLERGGHPRQRTTCSVCNLVIGNIATAVDAAGVEAEKRGYSHAMICAREPEDAAEDVGRHLAHFAMKMVKDSRKGNKDSPNCLISGGEPVVRLVEASRRGLGGRNQQLVLAALQAIGPENVAGIALLSGGTDGEDGPTDAAGAFFDERIVQAAQRSKLDPAEYLARNDAYHFFEPLDALLKTGPTQTNVGDLRVVIARRVY
jgi:hydroxypyruvate reductase